MLSSEKFNGRLSGTPGAFQAARFLAQSLQDMGIQEKGSDGYFSPVNVHAVRLVGPARVVIDGRELKHRIDFAEFSPHSSGGSVTGELITVRYDEDVIPETLAGKIVLIPNRTDGFDVKATVEAAADIGIAALLFESGESRWFHKTVFGSAENRIPVLRLRRSYAEQYAVQSGLRIEIDLPLETEKLPCRNVLGLLHGEDKSRTLLLCAHYDHLGDDPGGLRFPGSVDNASGVAVVLEVVRQLMKKSDLPFNLLVAFLTGEESGLWGARQLAANPPVPITAAINLDGLGYETQLHSMRTGHSTPGHWLADIAANVIQNHGIEVKWIAWGEDSVAFLEKRISTIGLGQKPTMHNATAIHTTEDDPDHLHPKPLIQGVSVIMDIVEQLKNVDSPFWGSKIQKIFWRDYNDQFH
jgi:aminopeptidase YwaD